MLRVLHNIYLALNTVGFTSLNFSIPQLQQSEQLSEILRKYHLFYLSFFLSCPTIYCKVIYNFSCFSYFWMYNIYPVDSMQFKRVLNDSGWDMGTGLMTTFSDPSFLSALILKSSNILRQKKKCHYRFFFLFFFPSVLTAQSTAQGF